jgi:hypothetical protein
MEEVKETGRLAADFFTHSYRISGHVDVRRRPLYDGLNDHTTRFLELDDAYISSIERPGEIITAYPSSFLLKENVTFVVVPHQDDALSRKHAYGSYYGAFLLRIFLTVPAFEITGHLRLSNRMDMRSVLTTGTDNFITVFDGRARSATQQDIVFTGGGLLVNKGQIGAFSVKEDR